MSDNGRYVRFRGVRLGNQVEPVGRAGYPPGSLQDRARPGDHPMAAAIVRRTDASFTVSVEVPYKGSMAAHPDRLGGDRGGVQGAGEAAAVRLGDALEGAWGGRGVERAMPDVHARALEPVLGPD